MTTNPEKPIFYRVRYTWSDDSSTLSSTYTSPEPAHNALSAAPPGSYIEASYDESEWHRVYPLPVHEGLAEAVEQIEAELEADKPEKSQVTESGDATVAPEESTALPVRPVAGPRSVIPGDYFVNQWGYDQTNVDFYRVKSLTKTGKSARLVKVANDLVKSSDNGSIDYVQPTEAEIGDEFTKRLLLNEKGNDWIMDMKHGVLQRFIHNGENTMAQTGAGWGH